MFSVLLMWGYPLWYSFGAHWVKCLCLTSVTVFVLATLLVSCFNEAPFIKKIIVIVVTIIIVKIKNNRIRCFLADERRHFVTLFFSSFKPNHFPSRFLLPPPCLRVHTATVRAGDLQMGLAFPRLLQICQSPMSSPVSEWPRTAWRWWRRNEGECGEEEVVAKHRVIWPMFKIV